MVLILDTSAISQEKVWDSIKIAEKVIIPSIVLRELNSLKDKESHKRSKLYKNIQKLFLESSKDQSSEKFFITNITQGHECPDEAIVRSATSIIDATIITSDYGMCQFCKLYNVKYILLLHENISSDSVQSANNLPFILERYTNKLIITCLREKIEIIRDNKETKVLQVNNKFSLTENDKVIVSIKREQEYVVKRKGKSLKLVPIN